MSQLSPDVIRARVRAVITRHSGRTTGELRPADRLLADLRIDDDALVFELAPEAEREAEFLASYEEWERIATVGDLEALAVRLHGLERPDVVAARSRRDAEIRRRVRRVFAAFGLGGVGLFALWRVAPGAAA
ncbi:MAG TPA: hypothetical protein VD838_22170, partial [Anaeromyxobacteraceae bacterium]|nr:hypothetical protein [Anaeromyxobacteraceae bacterium]